VGAESQVMPNQRDPNKKQLTVWRYEKEGVHTLNEEIKRKEKIMSFQTITVAPAGTQAVGSGREKNDDLGFGGTNRKSEVIYPVPLSIRILHIMWVVGTAASILMLMLFG